MAAGLLVIQPQVAFLGSCKCHSWISWLGSQPEGQRAGPWERCCEHHILQPGFHHRPPLLPWQKLPPAQNPKYNAILQRKESFLSRQVWPSLLFRGGGRCLEQGWAPTGVAQGWARGRWSSPGMICVTAVGPRVTSAQSGKGLASMCCQALLFRQLQMGTTWSPK